MTVLFLGCSNQELENKADQTVGPTQAKGPTATNDVVTATVADFEGKGGEFINNLGGENGTWNMNPADENNSYADMTVVRIPGKDGSDSQVLRLTYSVESELPSQNGFWTKLVDFDGSAYDHLALDVKGDAEKGFTEQFRLEVKKCQDENCLQTVQGSTVVPVTAEWQTVSIPLNELTGLINFSDPKAWENPLVSYEGLDELILIFNDRFVTKATGRIFIDNIRFLKTGKPGPTAVDQPSRKGEKTNLSYDSPEYQSFLISRLRGFPKVSSLKKEFPQDEKAFLMELARDTWKFFDNIVDAENHLPLDNIQIGDKIPAGEGVWIGDYTNITNIGIYLMSLVSAYDLGFITREEAIKRMGDTLDVLEELEYHSSGFPYNYYDTTLLDRTSYFISFVDSGWLAIGVRVAKNAFPKELGARADRLLQQWNFKFFYDPVEKQMYHGFYENLGVYTNYHYGVFYAEIRAAGYMAVALGEVPEEYWFEGPVRTFPANFKWQSQTPHDRFEKETLGYRYEGGYYEWKDLKYVPSWGGSMFEALMPDLVLKERELSPESYGRNNTAHVQGQIRYALDELQQPVWGMSPCAVPGGTYSEYGAPPFGIKGYKIGVVTPHATVLALEYAPEEAIANLRKLMELYDIYGEYGFYDAVDTKTGQVARKYYSLDQGMILIALNNYLNHGAIRNRFHADPDMRKAEKLITSENFFEEAPQTTT